MLSEPQDELDEPPAVVKRVSKSGKRLTRHLADFRKKVAEDYITQVSVKVGREKVGGNL